MVAFMEKAAASGISMLPSLRRDAKKRARASGDESLSRYVQRLIKSDLESEPAPTSYDDRILEKLAKIYAGYFAPTLTMQLTREAASQPRLLHDLLFELSDYFARGNASPSQPLLMTPDEALAFDTAAYDRCTGRRTHARGTIKYPIAAETPAPYHPAP